MKIQSLVCFLLLLLPVELLAQAVTNTQTERNISSDNYGRFNYENDYFTATDKYYTQGLYLESVNPIFRYNPITYILYHPAADELKYGLALQHNAYTPSNYDRPQILYGDRPYCADLFTQSFAIATDVNRKQRITTSLSLGIIGPAAGGQEMQTFIHKNTHNGIPQGWTHQINNDLVLNYEFDYQKQLIGLGNFLNITADGMARAGTLSDKANAGLTFMAGFFNSPFQSLTGAKHKIQIYVYDHPEVNVVGYDATMQGGVFDHNNQYTVTSDSLSRVVLRNNWGVVVQLNKVYLEYYQSYMTKEFEGGIFHRSGGIQIGVGF